MATSETSAEVQAQIEALKQKVAELSAIVLPEVVIDAPAATGISVLPNPTQAEIVAQINASFAIAANAVQSSTTTLANTVAHLLENSTLTGNTQIVSLGVGTAASGTTGEIRATNNITAYYSDDGLKTRLGVIENALDKIDQLTGFYYEANDVAQRMGYEKIREVGVSAQDTQKVLKEIVAPAPIDDRYLTVRYERFAPLLIEGIKELRSEINKIKQHLNI